ncbi:4Fe-4S dicluster domain-containing protein, partial [uncultured Desulfovibrio sp.]|uniref:4Fe-4S dicluster domain-containing protein n=1 Tax=uncultured Desulfovibrio sp. TaxID=167968 RepID=UPI0026393D4E
QCVNPPCVNLCPPGAARQRATGAVYIDGDSCLGDGRCIRFCPWMIPRRQSGVGVYLDLAPRFLGNGRVFKCDYCQDLLALGQAPACVTACPRKAQHFGPRAEMLALADRLVRERNGDIYGINVNGGTNTLYVSALRFRDIEVELLRQDQIGAGRPSLRPAGASMTRENGLLGPVLAAPLAGAGLACLRLWRDRQKGRRP